MVEVQATKAGRAALAEARATQVARLAKDLGNLDLAERDLLASALGILERLDSRQIDREKLTLRRRTGASARRGFEIVR